MSDLVAFAEKVARRLDGRVFYEEPPRVVVPGYNLTIEGIVYHSPLIRANDAGAAATRALLSLQSALREEAALRDPQERLVTEPNTACDAALEQIETALKALAEAVAYIPEPVR